MARSARSQWVSHLRNNPREWRWLCHVVELHSARAVCARTGISEPVMSYVLHGDSPKGRSMNAGTFRPKLFAEYPIPDDFEPVTVTPLDPGKYGQDFNRNEDRVWLGISQGDTISWTRKGEEARDQRSDADVLLSHETFQQVAAQVREATSLDLSSILLPSPTEGPCIEMLECVRLIDGNIAEANKRWKLIEADKHSDLYRGYSAHIETLTKKREKLLKFDDPSDIVKGEAWRWFEAELVHAVRDETEARLAILEKLRPNIDAFSKRIIATLELVRSLSFPCERYQRDPVAFCREILGVEPHFKQIELLEAIRDGKRIVAPSGGGLGKTTCVGWVVWWWVCCFEDGAVTVSNFTGNQLFTQDWFEIKKAFNGSGICLECRKAGITQRPCQHSQIIDGQIKSRGWESDDGLRRVILVTGDVQTALGGYHSAHLLVICDEFSGLEQEMYEAWRRNVTPAGCKFFGPGNPLRSYGPMYDAVEDEKIRKMYDWRVVRFDGEELCKLGLPYLPDANELKIQAMEDPILGRENPSYMINVRGLYPKYDQLAIYKMEDILRAQNRENYAKTLAVGKLVITLDPARPEGHGDLGVFAVTRGQKCLRFEKGRGWSEDQCLQLLLDLIVEYSDGTEIVLVGVDADGIGASIVRRFTDYLYSTAIPEHTKARFEVIPVHFGAMAPSLLNYELVRDEAHAKLRDWQLFGGVWPVDPHLQQEMHYSRWQNVYRDRGGVLKRLLLTSTKKEGVGKETYQHLLHRSPDTLDAMLLFAFVAYMYNALATAPEMSEAAQLDANSKIRPIGNADPRTQRMAQQRASGNNWMQRYANRKLGTR